MPRSRYLFVDQGAPCFRTMIVNNRLPLFTRPQTVEFLLECRRYLQRNHAFRLHGYVILENHPCGRPLPGPGKRHPALQVLYCQAHPGPLEGRWSDPLAGPFGPVQAPHKVGSQFQVREEGSHPQRIAGEEMTRQKLDYIHFNPVKRG